MGGKIFYRKSGRHTQGGRNLRVVAVIDADIKFSASHVSMGELKIIATSVEAELIQLDDRRRHRRDR